jgi:predicted ATPase
LGYILKRSHDVFRHDRLGDIARPSMNNGACYLRSRWSGRIPRLKELAEVLGRRTGGLPLFLTTVVDELMRRRILEGTDATGFAPTDLQAIANVIPTGVRQFIEHRFEQLSGEDQEILETAGVAGDPFSLTAVVAALSLPEERVEARCAAWAWEGQFVSAGGTVGWPDGTLAARYRFRHALFQEVVYALTSPERRARLHQRIGSRLEGAYGKGAATIAAELAMHFEQGRDGRRAVAYLGQAARNALQRSAYSEARGRLTGGLGLLENLRQGRERLRQELELSLLLGQVLMTTKGWGDEEVGRVYARSHELCEQLGDTSRLLQATWGLIAVSLVRADLRKAQALSRDLLGLAKKRRDLVYQVLAHTELGGTGFGRRR